MRASVPARIAGVAAIALLVSGCARSLDARGMSDVVGRLAGTAVSMEQASAGPCSTTLRRDAASDITVREVGSDYLVLHGGGTTTLIPLTALCFRLD